MNQYLLQGLSTATPLLIGVGGMLLNSWVAAYRDDQHFYKTRFLDRDGDPNSSDPGYFKDASGKLIPIVVEKYSFGGCRKKRYVEGFEVCEDGYGLPFKMSLKDFRSKEIRGVKFDLKPCQRKLVDKHILDPQGKDHNEPVSVDLLAVLSKIQEIAENMQHDNLSTSIRDLARSVDSLTTTTQHLRRGIAEKKKK